MPTEFLAMIVGVFLLAGWVKGVVGMGLPTVTMGALGLAMPPVQAAALLVVPSLVTNVWQFVAGPSAWRIVRRLASMLIFVCAGTAVPYISALGLTKDELIQALGLSFTVSTVALGVPLGSSGGFSPGVLLASFGAVVPRLSACLRVRPRESNRAGRVSQVVPLAAGYLDSLASCSTERATR